MQTADQTEVNTTGRYRKRGSSAWKTSTKYYELGENAGARVARGERRDTPRRVCGHHGASGSGKSTFMNMLGLPGPGPARGDTCSKASMYRKHDKRALAQIRNQKIWICLPRIQSARAHDGAGKHGAANAVHQDRHEERQRARG